jgi:hypothetical protein
VWIEPWRKVQKAKHLQRGDGRPTRYTARSLGHVAARAFGHAVSEKKQEAPDSSAAAPLPTRCICRSTSLLLSGHPHDRWRCLGWTVGRYYGPTRHFRPAVRPPTPRSGRPHEPPVAGVAGHRALPPSGEDGLLARRRGHRLRWSLSAAPLRGACQKPSARSGGAPQRGIAGGISVKPKGSFAKLTMLVRSEPLIRPTRRPRAARDVAL